MIEYKSKSEIEIMKEGGEMLKRVVAELLPWINVGVTTGEIDRKAEELINKQGGESSFNKVEGYKWSTCLPINEQAVHTPPSNRKVNINDVLTVDIGVYHKGFHTDYSTTFVVGAKADNKTAHFLKTGEEALDKAMSKLKNGARLGEISKEIQDNIYGQGYFILKELTGHGIGRELHEDPFVPGFINRPVEKTLEVKPGLVVAIEIIYSTGTEKIAYEKGDDWSIISADHSLTACFEHTLAVTENGTLRLT